MNGENFFKLFKVKKKKKNPSSFLSLPSATDPPLHPPGSLNSYVKVDWAEMVSSGAKGPSGESKCLKLLTEIEKKKKSLPFTILNPSPTKDRNSCKIASKHSSL